jgi:hypothetical protein
MLKPTDEYQMLISSFNRNQNVTRNYYISIINKYNGSDKVFIVGGKSFVYITKGKGSRTDPWGIFPSLRKSSELNLMSLFIFIICLQDRI